MNTPEPPEMAHARALVETDERGRENILRMAAERDWRRLRRTPWQSIGGSEAAWRAWCETAGWSEVWEVEKALRDLAVGVPEGAFEASERWEAAGRPLCG